MRAAAAILILLLLAGCAGNEAPVQQPSMYADMSVPGSKLDAQAAAIMISQYRQNNGLGTVAIDPDLMRLAESQSQAMAAANKMDHDVRAPLAKRLSAGNYPATVATVRRGVNASRDQVWLIGGPSTPGSWSRTPCTWCLEHSPPLCPIL